jgi:esterase/lipase superfamily enzyme
MDYKGKEIKKFSTMEKHCLYIWNEIIEKYSVSKDIYIIAHSMGGVCTIKILQEALLYNNNITFIKKIIFTDSVHGDKLANLLKTEKLPEKLKNVNL